MDEFEAGKRYMQRGVEIAATELGRSAIRGAESLNSKTSALLTHVSIMMAINSAFLGSFGTENVGGKRQTDVFLVLEIALYLIICVICLRAIWASSDSSYKKSNLNPIDRLIEITTRRRKRYQQALVLAIWVTAAFFSDVIYYALGNNPMTPHFLSNSIMSFIKNIQ